MIGPGRRGRRDNGLVAAEYAAAGDVDPRVGEHLLDVLAVDGIAAYLSPATDLHPVTRTTFLPSRPTDRLFVDRRHLSEAREALRQLVDERDERWEHLIAQFDAPADPASSPWPAAEDLPEPTGSPPDAGTSGPAARPVLRAQDEPTLLDALDMDFSDDGEDGYTPPPPPPLPRLSRYAVIGLIILGAGLALLFWPNLLPLAPRTTMLLSVLGIITGAMVLIWRLRPGDEDDEDADPDDGAVV